MASHTPHVHPQPQPLVDTHDPTHPPPTPHFHWGVTTRPCSVTATNWQQAHPKSPRAQPCQHSVKTVDIFKKTHSSTATEIHGFSPTRSIRNRNPSEAEWSSQDSTVQSCATGSGTLARWKSQSLVVVMSCLATICPISRSSQAPIYTTPFSLNICLLRDVWISRCRSLSLFRTPRHTLSADGRCLYRPGGVHSV